MNRKRPFLGIGICLSSLLFVSLTGNNSRAEAQETDRPPNIVVIFTDDLGYADVGCFGADKIQTPHLDRMAQQGIRLTDFHVAAAVCSASRAALLTGCYPQRVSILGALGPGSRTGIHDEELLLSELLQQRGYATAIYGKWHLGDDRRFLPLQHGFDDYFGLPYSNDMWPFHPTNKSFPDLPLIEGNEILEHNPDQRQLTTWYTERAVRFIEQHQDRPFFLYLPHSMPHVPLFVSEKHEGRSAAGLYGDVIEEIDWSVGQILAALQRCGIDQQTLVWFTSDNGPWLSYGNHAGSAGPLREGKGTSWEGGTRVPCIVRWPGQIPSGQSCDEFASTMDLLPTVAHLTGDPLPQDRRRDGHNIWALLQGDPKARSPYDVFYYYTNRDLEAVRRGPWKLVFPHAYRSLTGSPGQDGKPDGYTRQQTGKALYNLQTDLGETTDLQDQHPEIVRQLEQLAEEARRDLGDRLTGIDGQNVRPAGRRP